MPSSTYTDMEDHRALHLALELSLLGYNEGSEHHASEPLSVYDEIRLKKSQNMTECVPVPSSEHVAEIVGRQGCKIKALRAKTNTYIKTPVRGEEPVFVVTGRREDVAAAKREILSAAEHFSQIRASRRNSIVNGVAGAGLVPPTPIPGQTTIQVRVPYRVVGLVVGPKGATIKRIQQQTHTYIVTPSRDKEPVFEVTGLPENVEQAKKEIEGHIALRTGLSSGLNDEAAELHLNLALSGLNGLGGLDPQLLMGLGTSELMSSLYKTQRNGHHSQATPPLSSSNSSSNQSVTPPSDPLGLLSNLNALNSLADFSYLDHAPTVGGAPFNSGSNDSPASKLDLGFGTGLSGFGSLYEPDEGIVLSGSDSPTFGSALLPPSNIWSADYGKFSASSLGLSKRSSPGFGLDSMESLLRSSSSSSSGDHALHHHLPARRTSSDPLASITSTLASFGLGSMHDSHDCSDPCSRDSQSPAADSTDSPLEGGTTSPTSSGSSSRGSLKRECVLCCDSEVVAALVPCGHNLFCMDCAQRIVEAGDAKSNECPVCHQAVSQAIRIFSQ